MTYMTTFTFTNEIKEILDNKENKSLFVREAIKLYEEYKKNGGVQGNAQDSFTMSEESYQKFRTLAKGLNLTETDFFDRVVNFIGDNKELIEIYGREV